MCGLLQEVHRACYFKFSGATVVIPVVFVKFYYKMSLSNLFFLQPEAKCKFFLSTKHKTSLSEYVDQTIYTESHRPYAISHYLAYLYRQSYFYICSIQNADDVIETNISKWRPIGTFFRINICSSVYVLHL